MTASTAFTASEGIFVAVAGALLALLMGGEAGVASACLLLAGACAGFLMWNRPPAMIFLGDVGSGYLGFVIAVLALACAAGTQSRCGHGWSWAARFSLTQR